MEINLSYENALKMWPEKVKEVLDKQKNSKSKNKNLLPNELNWKLSYAERINCLSFTDLLSGKQEKEEPRVNRIMVTLVAYKNNSRFESEVFKNSKKLLNFIEKEEKRMHDKNKNEKLDNMTNEELIRELGKYGGFSMVGFNPKSNELEVTNNVDDMIDKINKK